jgi:hypothetical protein
MTDMKSQLRAEAKSLRADNKEIRGNIREQKQVITGANKLMRPMDRTLAKNMKRLERIKELLTK